VAIATNVAWLVPLTLVGGEGLIFLHQRHVGVVLDESHKTLVVQNFFCRSAIPFASIGRIVPGYQRLGPPRCSIAVPGRGGVHSINIVYRSEGGRERVVAPMSTASQFVHQPTSSPLVEALAGLCQRRTIPCDLTEFGGEPASLQGATSPPPGDPSPPPGDASSALPGTPRSTNLFYVNGVGVRRQFGIASLALMVGGLLSTGILHSGTVFLLCGSASVGTFAAGRQKGSGSGSTTA
jgi:hypothetical protein